MRAAESRACDACGKPRHPANLTNAERALAAPLTPPAKRGDNKRTGASRRQPHDGHRAGALERTIAWLNRCRRPAKDWECLNRWAPAALHLAPIRLMPRQLCCANRDPGWTLNNSLLFIT